MDIVPGLHAGTVIHAVTSLVAALYKQYQAMRRLKREVQPLGDLLHALHVCLDEAQGAEGVPSKSACTVIGNLREYLLRAGEFMARVDAFGKLSTFCKAEGLRTDIKTLIDGIQCQLALLDFETLNVARRSCESLRAITSQLGSLSCIFDKHLKQLHAVGDLLKAQRSRQGLEHEELTCLIKEILAKMQLLGRPITQLQAEEAFIASNGQEKCEFEQFVIQQVLKMSIEESLQTGDATLPTDFICPITGSIMLRPVFLVDGNLPRTILVTCMKRLVLLAGWIYQVEIPLQI